MGDIFDNKIYDLYYTEVGLHAILTSKEERKLLLRYHCCPHCTRRIPPRTDASNCPECGAVVPDKLNGRDFICPDCSKNYAAVINTKVCPHCGSGRDLMARQELIEANLRFVIRRAKKFSQNPDMLSTLISAGNIGLVQAVDRFDVGTNHRFLTYAEWWIRKEIMDELNSTGIVHVPTHKQKTLRRVYKEGKYLCNHCGVRTDNDYDVGHLPICTHPEGHDLELPLHRDTLLLSDAVELDETTCVTRDNVEFNCCTSEMGDILRNIIDDMQLGERDKFIVLGYFDAVTPDRKSEPKKLPQLAALTGITPERVRQIKEILLGQLRRELRKASITETSSLLPEALS